MPTKVIMPQLGESVVEGTVTKWLKDVGEPIDEFEPLLEVNTDKVDTEVPSPAGGTILKLYVAEGTTVKAGTLLAVIGEPGEEVPEAPEAASEVDALKERRAEHREPARVVPPEPTKPMGFISPVVARMAAEHAIDLTQIKGSGRNNRITKKDVLAYLSSRDTEPGETPAPWELPAFGELFRPTEELFGDAGPSQPRPPVDQPKPGEILPLDAVRRSIADHMLRSKQTSPHVTTVVEADLSAIVTHREVHKALYSRDGVRLTYSAYFVAAAAEALRAVPLVNSTWGEEGIILQPAVHIGVAVSLGQQGLIVPVIRDADQISLRGLASTIADFAMRARAKDLKPDEVRGGTFTITNHGVSGSLFATPIINQPQCAILGVGAIQKRVIVVEGHADTGGAGDAIAIRPMVYLTLTFDHRILDGAIADAFLSVIVRRLQAWR